MIFLHSVASFIPINKAIAAKTANRQRFQWTMRSTGLHLAIEPSGSRL
jgi:hypothetical protein